MTAFNNKIKTITINSKLCCQHAGLFIQNDILQYSNFHITRICYIPTDVDLHVYYVTPFIHQIFYVKPIKYTYYKDLLYPNRCGSLYLPHSSLHTSNPLCWTYKIILMFWNQCVKLLIINSMVQRRLLIDFLLGFKISIHINKWLWCAHYNATMENWTSA